MSDAVAVLLTALTAVKRGVAPHCWHEIVLAAARPELAAVTTRHEDVS